MSTARGERRINLQATRAALYSLPINESFELPGRPHVYYQLWSYSDTADPIQAALQARSDVPFLFKAFETGQIGPKRMAKIHGGKPRVATIHEYLDWTVTAQKAEADDELDFGGFRVLVLLPRYKSHWPAPSSLNMAEGARSHPKLGAPKPPMPFLQSHGKPMSAATIRSGPGYLEVPFVATHETKRGRGYCRCLLEAIEDVARALELPKLMLCSTNDDAVKSTWSHLGFSFTEEEEMEHKWDVLHSDLVYLQNTVQMHKDVAPVRRYRSIMIKHGDYVQRTYMPLDKRESAAKSRQPVRCAITQPVQPTSTGNQTDLLTSPCVSNGAVQQLSIPLTTPATVPDSTEQNGLAGKELNGTQAESEQKPQEDPAQAVQT